MERKLGNGHAHSEMHSESKTAGYFLEKLQESINENFASLHEEIEELEDKIERLEKLLAKK